MSTQPRATPLPETGGAVTSDADTVEGAGEVVALGLVRDVRLMADGRRITYYRREAQ